jgi:DNA-binding transcriptional regulator LsrR (DeoR family)
VAGWRDKVAAIAAALEAGHAALLITDRATAESLLSHTP